MPRLTIVIPTVNRSSLVARAVESALAQAYRDMEIIVSNNGSTDNTRETLDRYRDPRLRILHRKDTIPAYAHGNALLPSIAGEFVLFLSDDDYLEPRFAQAVMDLIDRHPSVIFAYAACWLHYGDVVIASRGGPELESGTDFLEAFLTGAREPCWCAIVSRTAAIRRVGAMPKDTICGDMFYWSQLATSGDVACVPVPLSHYTAFRDGVENISAGTPVLEWSTELSSYYEQIILACERVSNRPRPIQTIRRRAAQRLAHVSADQFLWNVIRGRSRLALLLSLGRCRRYLRWGGAASWIRVLAFVTLPKWFLRRALWRRLQATARRQRTCFTDTRL